MSSLSFAKKGHEYGQFTAREDAHLNGTYPEAKPRGPAPLLQRVSHEIFVEQYNRPSMRSAHAFALVCVLWGCSAAPPPKRVILIPQLPVWEPPEIREFPRDTKSTVPKELVTSLKLSGLDIVLEQTKLADVQRQFGGAIGRRGDAATSVSWLCIRANDVDEDGVLWLMSSEIDAGTVGGFRWQLERPKPHFDPKCATITKGPRVELPIPLRIGIAESKVLEILGRPGKRTELTWFYLHEHETTLHDQPYTVMNTLALVVHGGIVRSIEVWKSTTP